MYKYIFTVATHAHFTHLAKKIKKQSEAFFEGIHLKWI